MITTTQRVHDLCTSNNISIYKLSKLSDVPYSTIRTSEKRNGELSLDIIQRICSALNISVAEFFSVFS